MRIDQSIYDACSAGDFEHASLLFRESCTMADGCGCADKTLQSAARCLSAHLTYLSLTKKDEGYHTLATRINHWTRETRVEV